MGLDSDKQVCESHKTRILQMGKSKLFKKIGLLIIGTLTAQLAFSQENYVPGYVIKNNTDTLFGFVDYRNWKNNPDRIMFKTKMQYDPVSFNPTDITEFYVEGEIYVSAIINTEISPTRTDELTEGSQLNLAVDTTFLQTLVRGGKSLYFYKNPEGRDNFYIKQETGLELLVYKRYLKQQDGKLVSVENRNYLGQLALYLNDCETINSKLENTSYELTSLIKLFQYYYNCSPSDISFHRKTDRIRSESGLLTGVSLTSLQLLSDEFPYLVYADYNPSVNLSAGFFLDLILPRDQGKWSIYNELLLTTYKVSGSYEEFVTENDYTITTTEIGYSYLNINNLVRFKYPVGQCYLFLNGGISNGFAVSESNYKKEESKFYTTSKVDEGLAINDTRKFEQGYVFGTGFRYDRFSFEIRYEMRNGMSKYVTLNSSTKRYYLQLSYRF